MSDGTDAPSGRTGHDRPPDEGQQQGGPAVDASDGADYVEAADRALADAYEPPMSLPEYVDHVLDRPRAASHAAKYLLDAIEHYGTRTVVERGEEVRRYRFFDDPENDGEHAVLGNTDVLNAFVDDLRAVVAGRGKGEKILWLAGPTATGKSEFKRCLVNGLRAYSRTEAGRRYTVEWNVRSAESGRGLSYGEGPTTDEDHWFESPVQTHPLTVFPESVREDLLAAVNDESDDHVDVRVEEELDPFSREAYDYLEERYRREGVEDLFSAITDESHLRVKNYVVDLGRGIGVLHSEDDGSPKERLVGSWMAGMLQELDSRGRKNPQAFSYDGVLSQGNGLLTVVEDAAQHADLLQRLLNVADEGAVKLDKAVRMDVDTILLVISNPDLEATLNQHADRSGDDPLKALKRRLDKHELRYLTSHRLEVELLRRELTDERTVGGIRGGDDDADPVPRAPLTLSVEQDDDVTERELAPHTLSAAALYAVVSRLDETDLPGGLDLVDKAMLFDRGHVRDGDERHGVEEFEFDDDADDGRQGIPVTYTRDVVADLLADESDRHHPELPVEDVVVPRDVLNAMVDGLADAPVFSAGERSTFEERVVGVKNHVFARQEEDVLAAIMRDKRVDEETVEEYVEHVYAWSTDGQVETDRGPADPDPLTMKVFEVEHLGRFDESAYDGDEPSAAVREFREEKVITALNRHAWQQRTEDFQVGDVDVTEIPVLKTVLSSHDWDDVRRAFEDFDPRQWDDPPADTETERVKEQAIENMVELFDYTEASAELTSRHVMGQVSYQWD